MKFLAVLFLLFGIVTTLAQPARTNAVLPLAHYDLAEVVFRQSIGSDSNVVFHLAYGTNDAPLPAEFIARFKGQTPIVRGMTEGITVVSNRFVLDKMTSRESVGLCIRTIRISGEAAEVQVKSFETETSQLTRFYLLRERGKWRITKQKLEWIACG